MSYTASELIKIRRQFHQQPELGFTEFWTTARICEMIHPLDCDLLYGDRLYQGFPVPDMLNQWDNAVYKSIQNQYPDDKWIKKLNGKTGAVAVIHGGQEGPSVCFRVDIDALPIKESDDMSHLPAKEGFGSLNENMHACGHDGHTTIGIGLAGKLSENRASLKGTYYIMFQPAEELIAGGRIFSKFDFVKTLDYFLPVHVGLKDTKEVICALSFLADRRYQVVFNGRSTHAGASPEQGKNALAAACAAVTSLFGISRHSDGCSRINVGRFSSDNASNVISDSTQFELDLRGETNEVCEYLEQQAQNIINGICAMYDINHEMRFITEAQTAANSPELISIVKTAALNTGIQKEHIMGHYLVSGSEDATFIMNEVLRNGGMSTYIGLGSETFGGHHNEKFDFDEIVLLTGVNLLYEVAKKLSTDA